MVAALHAAGVEKPAIRKSLHRKLHICSGGTKMMVIVASFETKTIQDNSIQKNFKPTSRSSSARKARVCFSGTKEMADGGSASYLNTFQKHIT